LRSLRVDLALRAWPSLAHVHLPRAPSDAPVIMNKPTALWLVGTGVMLYGVTYMCSWRDGIPEIAPPSSSPKVSKLRTMRQPVR
jgi:hypothetical protein